jgi:hypothetical protein
MEYLAASRNSHACPSKHLDAIDIEVDRQLKIRETEVIGAGSKTPPQ